MKISILGDSISTFEGVTPPDYQIYYRGSKRIENDLSSYDDTWWAQVIHFLHGTLCVNNAYSGCKVSKGIFPSASSEKRIERLHGHTEPDLILIYVGINDFGFNVPISKKRLLFSKPDPDYFFDAYTLMLKHIQQRYPNSKAICGTLLKTYIKNNTDWNFNTDFHTLHRLEDYNAAIRQICKKRKAICADLNKNDCAAYETLDGAHPTRVGHKQIAKCWITALDSINLNPDKSHTIML